MIKLCHKGEHAGYKSPCQNVGNDFCRNLKVVASPFVENAERAADGAGNHIGKLFFAVQGGCCILRDFRYVLVEHRHYFFKKTISPRTSEKICQKRIRFCVIADCQKIGFTHIAVIFGMKRFHKGEYILNRFVLNGCNKGRNIFVVIVKGAADNSCLFYNIGDGYLIDVLFAQHEKKRIVDSLVRDVVSFVLIFMIHTYLHSGAVCTLKTLFFSTHYNTNGRKIKILYHWRKAKQGLNFCHCAKTICLRHRIKRRGSDVFEWGKIMTCKEAAFSENALDYLIGNYRGESYVQQIYRPDCYLPLDNIQAVIYREADVINREAIERFGFNSIPNVYGLMSEEALEDSGVLRIRRQPYLDLYGQGVLIGFVDTGIDYTHEAFINADNTTRIVSIWDQTVEEGDGSASFPYGRVYEREEINQALASDNPFDVVPTRDENGHGTFLAGVASGYEIRCEQFSGVAPLSELVIVKCKEAKQIYRDYYSIPAGVPAYQENDILTGIAHIMEVAQREDKPVIICICMGTNMGSHDGGSYLSLFMERYTAVSGVAMMACIGNEGNARHHHLINRRVDTININVERSLDGFMTQLWWRSPGRLTMDFISPSGETYEGIRTMVGERRTIRFVAENTVLEIYFGQSQEITNEQVVSMRFISPKTGIWKIRTTADYDEPRFHIWLPIRQFLPEEVVFLEPNPDTTLSSVGTGLYTMAVSAYDVAEDSLYLQAGRGFTPLGRIKPEFVAPGVNITGTYPRNRYGTMSGTGAATAFSAGIGALFMQNYSRYYINGIMLREIFIRGARQRGEPFPNTEWGYGIVDAYASITD